MLPWSNQKGPCLFCRLNLSRVVLIRPLSKTSRSISSRFKPEQTGVRRSLLRTGFDPARAKPPDKNKRVTLRSVRNAKDDSRDLVPLGFSLRRTVGTHDVEEVALNKWLGRFLDALQKQLESTKIDDEDITQMQGLDPTGLLWPEFKDMVKRMCTGGDPQSSWSVEQKQLYKDLCALMKNEKNWYAQGSSVLHFAFIDHVVGKQKTAQEFDNATSGPPKVTSSADLRYPTEWYTAARALQRDIHLHVGPTNSGKTYAALKRLEEAGNGFYAGPLRLLAHEVYSRFRAKGIPCDLVTGDDVRLDESADVLLYASTVEMVDVSRLVDVAVIDEIQMMASPDRGWAWTRAFLGANAREVHLCGETRVVPLIQELCASMGDTLHIHEYSRLNPLQAASKSLHGSLRGLRKGDCVVSFSIVEIHALKKQIEEATGKRAAVVYGSLPPETRAQQAALFNDPDNDYDYLVASDAIGMGLNLSIKRVVFESISRFNGRFAEQLSVSHIKQIAGRAGRYRSAHDAITKQDGNKTRSIGLVTCLDEADLPVIQRALSTEAPPIRSAGILPPADFLEDYATRLPKGVPWAYLFRRLCDAATMHPRFTMCDSQSQVEIGRTIESVRKLTVAQRCVICSSPSRCRDVQSQSVTIALARCISQHRSVTVADIPEIPLEILEQPMSLDRGYLAALERLHQSLILYLWLSYRFMSTFKDRDMAAHAKAMTEEKINACLLEYSADPATRLRLKRLKELKISQIAMNEAQQSHESDQPDPESDLTERGVEEPSVLGPDWTGNSTASTAFAPAEDSTSQELRAHG